jgi:hypothetical protein
MYKLYLLDALGKGEKSALEVLAIFTMRDAECTALKRLKRRQKENVAGGLPLEMF